MWIEKPQHWSQAYFERVERNIGVVSLKDQERLRSTRVAVLGTGGLGGPVAEQLVRSGCQHLTLADHDIFERPNLNRQLCYRQDLGRKKVDVLEEQLLNIDTELALRKFYGVTETNIPDLLSDCSIVVLAMDDPILAIAVARESRERNIPLVISWGNANLCAWWFTRENMEFESFFGLNLCQYSIGKIKSDPELITAVKRGFLKKAFGMAGVREFMSREKDGLERMEAMTLSIRTFAPMVRIAASYLAFEVIFAGVLNYKEKTLAPRTLGYDYFNMTPIKLDFVD
jgi:hypothetical protein